MAHAIRACIVAAAILGIVLPLPPAAAQEAPSRFGCSIAPGPPVLRSDANCRRVVIGGFERDYVLTVPRQLGTEPLPLVVALPDSGAGLGLFSRVNGFNSAVDAGEAILVVPHPLPHIVPDRYGDPHWRERWTPDDVVAAATPRPADYPADAPWPVDDAAYVLAVIAAVRAEVAVDPARIFVSGLGEAGVFAVQLAYRHPDLFAAAGVGVAGFDLGLPPGLPPASSPPAVFAMLGDRDGDVTGQFGGRPVPLDAAEFLADPARFAPVLDAFGLAAPACSAAVREDGNVMTIVFCTADGTAGFTFILVRGVGHEAPNAINNPSRYTFAPEMWRLFGTVPAGG